MDKNGGSVNIVTFPIHGAGLKVAEMASMLSEMGIKINKVCFDHTTVKDLYELPKAELTITDYPMAWARLMKERFDVDHYEILAWDRMVLIKYNNLLRSALKIKKLKSNFDI